MCKEKTKTIFDFNQESVVFRIVVHIFDAFSLPGYCRPIIAGHVPVYALVTTNRFLLMESTSLVDFFNLIHHSDWFCI